MNNKTAAFKILVIQVVSVVFLSLSASCLEKIQIHTIQPDAFTPRSTSEFLRPPYGLFEDGILFFDYSSRYKELGKYPNPTFVAAYANALYRDYLKQPTSEIKKQFFNNVDFLIRSALTDQQGSFWSYPFSNPHFDAPEGWYSAMTSGRILGVLARAHHLSGDHKYLQFAQSVFNKMKGSLDQGGMVTYQGDDAAWLEEVAHRGAPSHKVLNGHIYALSGLIDYANYTSNQEALNLVQSAFIAVEKSSELFDAGFLSYYCQYMREGRLPSFAQKGGYNVTHTYQMLWLYQQTGNEKFLRNAMRFQYYENFKPEITATSSVNAVSHGPDKMNLTFGNNYWSSNVFPVEVKINFPQQKEILEVVLLGHSEATSPSQFEIYGRFGEEWRSIIQIHQNILQRARIKLPEPVTTNAILLKIQTAAGKRLVALGGVGIVAANPVTPLVDFRNYSPSIHNISDGDINTGLSIRTDGFLIVPMSATNSECKIYGSFSETSNLHFYGSNDLENWKSFRLKSIPEKDKVRISVDSFNCSFLKIEFSKKEVDKISEIILN